MLMQLTAWTQEAAPSQDNSGVVVLKSSWSSSTQNPNALYPSIGREHRGRGEGRMGRRGRGQAQTRKGFDYKLKVQNTGAKTVTALLWEYQSGEPTGPQDVPNLQFLCQEKMKPGATKSLEVFSPSPPTRVVNASAGGEDGAAAPAVTPLIDRVEYADGTSWERAGWAQPKSTAYPADLSPTFGKSKCSGF